MAQELYGPLDSLAARKRVLEERRARLLAKAAQTSPLPQGQMVSGHFVAPNWAQYLPNLFDKYQQGAEQRSIEEAMLAQGLAEKAALRDSLAGLTGTPEQAATPFGSRDEPRQDATPAIPPAMGNDRRAIIAQLIDNPAAGAIGADLLKDDLIEAPRRAEAARVREAEAERARIERGEQLAADRLARAEAAKQRSEDLRLSLEQRAQAAREHNDLMRELASMRVSAQRDIAVMRGSDKPIKPLPSAVHKELSSLEDTAGNMASLASSFKPEYGGTKAAIAVAAAPYFPEALVPGKAPDDTANWWKNYRKQAELVERHALFGASLTKGEQDAWRSADIAPGMGPKIIQKNLDTRKALAEKLYANAVDRYEKGGYPQVRGAFDPASIRSTGGDGVPTREAGVPAGWTVRTK